MQEGDTVVISCPAGTKSLLFEKLPPGAGLPPDDEADEEPAQAQGQGQGPEAKAEAAASGASSSTAAAPTAATALANGNGTATTSTSGGTAPTTGVCPGAKYRW